MVAVSLQVIDDPLYCGLVVILKLTAQCIGKHLADRLANQIVVAAFEYDTLKPRWAAERMPVRESTRCINILEYLLRPRGMALIRVGHRRMVDLHRELVLIAPPAEVIEVLEAES